MLLRCLIHRKALSSDYSGVKFLTCILIVQYYYSVSLEDHSSTRIMGTVFCEDDWWCHDLPHYNDHDIIRNPNGRSVCRSCRHATYLPRASSDATGGLKVWNFVWWYWWYLAACTWLLGWEVLYFALMYQLFINGSSVASAMNLHQAQDENSKTKNTEKATLTYLCAHICVVLSVFLVWGGVFITYFWYWTWSVISKTDNEKNVCSCQLCSCRCSISMTRGRLHFHHGTSLPIHHLMFHALVLVHHRFVGRLAAVILSDSQQYFPATTTHTVWPQIHRKLLTVLRAPCANHLHVKNAFFSHMPDRVTWNPHLSSTQKQALLQCRIILHWLGCIIYSKTNVCLRCRYVQLEKFTVCSTITSLKFWGNMNTYIRFGQWRGQKQTFSLRDFSFWYVLLCGDSLRGKYAAAYYFSSEQNNMSQHYITEAQAEVS